MKVGIEFNLRFKAESISQDNLEAALMDFGSKSMRAVAILIFALRRGLSLSHGVTSRLDRGEMANHMAVRAEVDKRRL